MQHLQTRIIHIPVLFTIFLLYASISFADGRWASTYGGLDFDYVTAIEQTSDGGYIMAGYTHSFGAGDRDAWVLKLDSAGAVTWQKTYGGTLYDYAKSTQQTADGGYIVAGDTLSFGVGSYDFWIMKLDSDGGITWQRTYGGSGSDYPSSIQQTADGGYIVAGGTWSFGAGDRDAWVLKLDSAGAVTWQKTYGGAGSDSINTIEQTSDGGYIMAGYTHSFGAGDRDAWVLKLDSAGAVTWQKTYGGAGSDSINTIEQTSDGGYIMAGYTHSFGAGDRDAWVLKLDSAGAVTWQKTYGGAGSDYAYSVRQTSDAEYAVAGFTQSFNTGNHDMWIAKIDSTGAIIWQKTYGAANYDDVSSFQQTQDGGYILAGGNEPAGHANDAFVIKLDSSGSVGPCSFERVSTAVVSDTTVVGLDTAIVPANTAVTGIDSTATVSDAFASANRWCPLTEEAQRLKVGVTRKKKGDGSVISGEGLIACPEKCQEDYNKDLTVTLYANPSDLSTFLGWKPSSSGCEGTNPCQVTMDTKKSVKATFQGPNRLRVGTIFKNNATGTVTSSDTLIACPGDCEEFYALNSRVTLTATAGAGSTFVKWTGTPCKDAPTNVCTLTMDKNVMVKAIFEKKSE